MLSSQARAMLVGALFCVFVASASSATSAESKIAFVRSYEAVYVMNVDGSGVRRVTPSAWESRYPVWSPDGKRIAFIRTGPSPSEYDPRDEIYVVTLNGTGLQRLTRNNRNDGEPTWSPDGRRIAFTSHESGINVVSTSGGASRALSRTGLDNQPDWSPVGNKIAYVSAGPAIHVMSEDGTRIRRLTDPGMGQDSAPAWSPDGRRIAFVRTPHFSDPGVSRDGIYLMNADGSGLRRITSIDADFPVWSADGRHIAFASWGRNDYDLYLMNADGTGLKRLARGTTGDVSWSPDGKQLVFSKSDAIWVVDSKGRDLRRLTRSSEVDSQPVWQVTS